MARTTFWCQNHQAYTKAATDPDNPGTPYCSRCNKDFHCLHCGFEIDWAGKCQRPAEDFENGVKDHD